MIYRYIISRPRYWEYPKYPLPIYARSVGHYILDHTFREYCRTNENYTQLIWGIKNSGIIIISGQKFVLSPNDIVLKFSTDTHQYEAFEDDWEFRWFNMDGEQADNFLRAYGYSGHLSNAGKCPIRCFLDIEHSIKALTPYMHRRLINTITSILAQIGGKYNGNNKAGLVCEKYMELIEQYYQNPQINVNILANKMHLHRTTINRLFTDVMKVTPAEYLLNFRLQKALSMLEGGFLSISEIANNVGIPNTSHFSRIVKRITGRTPKEIRINP